MRVTIMLAAWAIVLAAANALNAQSTPSYSKEIRPLLTKYCLECHNAKTQKGTLSLETHKAIMEGSDHGPVIVPGQPDKSKLVLLTEHKDKPRMPPEKAKFQPTKDEVKLLRAWVAAGAKYDAVTVKVELPAIKPKADVLSPVTAMRYCNTDGILLVGRGKSITGIMLDGPKKVEGQKLISAVGEVTALVTDSVSDLDIVATHSNGGGNTVSYVAFPLPKDVLTTHEHTILDLSFSGFMGKRWLASADYGGRIHLTSWRQEGKEPEKRHILKEHSDAVYGLAFNSDGTMLASVSADRAMKVFDVEKGKLLYTLGEASDWVYAVAWSPDGKYLVSGGVDKSIRVYEPTRTGAKLRQSVFAHEGAVQKLVFTGDSKTLYSVGEDRVVKAWDIEKMVERKVYDKQPETVLCLALREDAGQFIVGRYDGIVQLIDMKTGKVAHEFGAVKKKEQEKGKQPDGEKEPGLSSFSARAKEPFARALNEETVVKGKPGDIPLPMEVKNPSSSPATAQNLKLNAYLQGTLDRAGAVHFFRFDVVKDQEVGVHLQTAELKSKVDPVLVFTDMNGKVMAEGNLGHLGHKFTKAGTYAVGVRDREYRGGADFTYRMWIGTYAVITSVFPMGVQRGTQTDVTIEGVFLPKRTIPFFVPKDAKPGQVFTLDVKTEINLRGKAQIIAGEFPEVRDGGKIPVPGTANGQLTNDDQQDVWTFDAKKGQRLIVEVNARRIGSRLDSVIEILDKNDQPVPRALLRSQAKTNVTFRDHDSAGGGIRIEAWNDLAINDYLYVGNELMKIKELPTHPDADCNFFATAGQRLGYLDTTPTHHANGTPMYKVALHPPGTKFPPNGYPVFTLYYKNDDGGPGFGRDSRILFDPPADGIYKVRIADARGMGGANFGYRLTVRHPNEYFALKLSPTSPSVSRGSAIPMTFTADRIDGFTGPITVRITNLPPGLHMPATKIEAGMFSTTVALYADADAKIAANTPKLQFEGTGAVRGPSPGFARGARYIADIDAPRMIEPGDLVTTTTESEVSLKPGGQSKMLVRIERRNGFKGRVPLEVRGLPHGVKVLDIGLNGILVNENETSRTVVIYAEPWVQAQDHPIVVLAKREGKNTEHAAKSVLLKVK